MMNGAIEVENLSVRLPGFCLREISFSIGPGEFFLLLGPTGSGKTLTLEALAGLIPIHSGTIRINGNNVTHLPPERRGVGIVYQDYALFPHMSVQANIQYGVRYRKKERKWSRAEIADLMEQVGIGHLADRSIAALSGGERQRVALVRALAVNPSVLLLDEPLSALDPGFRDEIQQLLKNLHRETGTTFLMVTHDFAEALFLGQRVAVLSDGGIEQAGSVVDVFQKPASPFVARFTGIKNVFPAAFAGNRALLPGLELEMEAMPPSSARCVAIRREEIRIVKRLEASDGHNVIPGRVRETTHRGPYLEVWVETGQLVLRSAVTPSEFSRINPRPEQDVYLSIPRKSVLPL
jgi:molybdate/tungstate transport system ATP-binding protein